MQGQLEDANARALRPVAGDLVALMAGDVLQPPERGGSAQARMHTRMYTHTHTQTRMYTQTHTHAHTHTDTYTHTERDAHRLLHAMV